MALAISMVMLEEDGNVAVADIQRQLSKRWPKLPKATDVKQDDTSIAFRVGSADVILAKMPAPFPWSDLEGPCATSILWQNATDELKNHKIHWIVTVMGELQPVELSMLLTQATAAMMAACPAALGVYWGNATLVVPKDMFIAAAAEAQAEEPPLLVWVDFRIGRDEGKTSSGFTTGMAALGHMEFETEAAPEPPAELHARLLSLASYVVANGPVIRDGDTVGEDANERIRVVYSPSTFGHEGQVMRLRYEKSSPKKPWWKLW